MNTTPGWVNGLRRLMADEQIEQLAGLLANVVENGFGELEIVVVNGKVRFFRPQLSIPACFEDEGIIKK
jgi:hypothetical protein